MPLRQSAGTLFLTTWRAWIYGLILTVVLTALTDSAVAESIQLTSMHTKAPELPLHVDPLLEEVKSQMVVIPAGSFYMGCSKGDELCDSSEKPLHEVHVPSFKIGKHEVTFAQYDRFANATGRDLPSDSGWGRNNRPVINVSWESAQAFVQWLSEQTGLRFRLPSEAEWEYAARAGTTTTFIWGRRPLRRGKANCGNCNDGFRDSAPAGSYPPNAFGLFDMHGNVWELIMDQWHHDYAGAPIDGSSWDDGSGGDRVVRGGSMFFHVRHLRISVRRGIPATVTHRTVGFRIAQEI